MLLVFSVVTDVETAPMQSPGVVIKTALDQDGARLLIKVYGEPRY